MDGVVVVGALGVAASGVAYLLAAADRRARVVTAWSEAANALGGRYKPIDGPWYARKPATITADVEGVRVLVDTYDNHSGDSSKAFTRVRAAGAGTAGFRIELYREGILTSIGKAIGTQDIQTGDARFDDCFVVKSNDELFCRAWLNRRARDALVEAPSYEFGLDGDAVTATRFGIEIDAQALVAATRAAACLVAGGQVLLAEWRRAAAKIGGEVASSQKTFAPDSTTMEWDCRGVRVTFDAERAESGVLFRTSRVHTRARCALSGRGTSFVLCRGEPPKDATALGEVALRRTKLADEYRLFTPDPDRIADRLGPELEDRIRALRPVALIGVPEELTVLLEGVVTHAATLTAAGEIAAAFAAQARGPYR